MLKNEAQRGSITSLRLHSNVAVELRSDSDLCDSKAPAFTHHLMSSDRLAQVLHSTPLSHTNALFLSVPKVGFGFLALSQGTF